MVYFRTVFLLVGYCRVQLHFQVNMDAIQNMLKEEIDEEEKINIETHFLPATPCSEEDLLKRFYFSIHNHTKIISQGKLRRIPVHVRVCFK